jgi:hypothetical protein
MTRSTLHGGLLRPRPGCGLRSAFIVPLPRKYQDLREQSAGQGVKIAAQVLRTVGDS